MEAVDDVNGLASSLSRLARAWRRRAKSQERAADRLLTKGEDAWTDCSGNAQRLHECAAQVERILPKSAKAAS